MDSMDELIVRLEAADEGGRELDADVRFNVVGDMTRCNFDEGCYHGECETPGCGGWLGMVDERRSYPRNWQDDERLPHYTTSLDAAITLVPENHSIAIVIDNPESFPGEHGSWAEVRRLGVGSHIDWPLPQRASYAATSALALCIAALKAHQAQAQKAPATSGGAP